MRRLLIDADHERPHRVKVDTRSDSELVSTWLGGDTDAFAAVYDRYSDLLFSFALSRLRNRAEAADVVQDTFVRAADRLGQLRDPSRLRSWLYAIARNRVLDTVRRRPLQSADAQEFAEMPSDNMEPADVVAGSELSELVWMAADGLNDRDRELLGLHLRHGLDGADLADVVGMSPPQVYVAMNRLKQRLAKAVGALLIARHGSADCRDLGALLAGWDGTFSLDVRSKVTRHVEGCDVCAKRRAALIAPSNFAAGAFLLPIVAPATLRESTLRRVAQGGPVPDDATSWRTDGFPRARAAGPRRAVRAITAGALATAAVLVVVAIVVTAGDDTRQLTIDAPATAVTNADVTPVSDAAAASETEPATGPPTSAPESTQPAAVVAAPASHESVADPGPKSPAVAVVDTALAPTSTDVASSVGNLPPVPSSLPGPQPTSATAPPQTTTPQTNTPPAPPTVEPTVTNAGTSPPTPPPTPPPAPAGQVVVLTGPIDLGASQASGTIRIRNDGGQAIGWSAAASSAAFAAAPASGSLEPGQETAVQVSVNRSSLSEGSHTASVSIASANGGGAVTATARVERAPAISSFVRTPPVIRTSNTCGPSLTTVSVSVTDESGIASVEILWSSDGSFAQRTALAPGSGTNYSGQIGSFSNVGSNTLSLQVLDTRGNLATSSTTVTVVAC